MRARIIAPQIVRIVGRDQRQAGLVRQPVELWRELFILIEVVVLNFEKKVVAAENIRVRMRQTTRVFILVGENRLRNVPAQAGRKTDQALGMLGQQIQVDARLVIEALKVRGRDELDEIAVALLRLAQQHQMVVAILIGARLVALLRNIDLAADHGMNASRLAGVIEFHRPKEIAVIGHCHGRHFLLGDDLHQLGDCAGPIQQRIIRVAMQVNEGHRRRKLLGPETLRAFKGRLFSSL